jgi:cytochrome c biogenesis protein CcmG, thiol:disulfide interchange protein DsbE
MRTATAAGGNNEDQQIHQVPGNQLLPSLTVKKTPGHPGMITGLAKKLAFRHTQGMTRCLAWAAGLGFLTLRVMAEEQLETLKVGAVSYSNVVVLSVNATDVYFRHQGGMANVRLRLLEPELQKRFHYDPARASQMEREQQFNSLNYRQSVVYSRMTPVETDDPVVAEKREEPESQFSLLDPLTDNSLLNKPAPDLAVEKWFSDKPPPLAGKFVLVLVWQTTSAASRQAIPALNSLQKKYPQDLVIIGVTSESEREVKQMVEPALEFYYGSDTQSRLVRMAGITSVPTVLLIDPQKIVRYFGHPAAINEESLGKLIAKNPR